jgi:hypothetical protein
MEEVRGSIPLSSTNKPQVNSSYFGGATDATALPTVVRDIPNRSAICLFGTPSAASLRINAQSSQVITLQASSVHISTVDTDQFSSVVDRALRRSACVLRHGKLVVM